MELIQVLSNNLDDVLQNEKLILKFTASWCAPCNIIDRILHEVFQEIGDVDLVLGIVNVDEAKDIVKYYQITSVPTLLFIEKGNVVNTLSGVKNKELVKELILSLVNV